MFSEPTSNHMEIFFWAEAHDAMPAEMLSESEFNSDPVLSFLFYHSVLQEKIRPITWAEFFAAFEVANLSFVYEEHPSTSRNYLFQPRHYSANCLT